MTVLKNVFLAADVAVRLYRGDTHEYISTLIKKAEIKWENLQQAGNEIHPLKSELGLCDYGKNHNHDYLGQ